MRTIEKTIYNFNELSEEIKNKLIERKKEEEKDAYIEYCLYNDMQDKASDLVNDYFGITSDYLKAYYDLSYSQGSGAMIEFDITIKDLNNKYKVFSDEEIRFLTDKDIVNDIRVKHHNNMYYHEYTFILLYGYYNDYDFEDIQDDYNITEEDFNTIATRFYELVDYSNKHYTTSPFIKDIISMNIDLKNNGYSMLDYECDTDYIIDMLSEHEYYENGEVYQ